MIEFPAVKVTRQDNRFEGTAAMALESILTADLLQFSSPENSEKDVAGKNRRELQWAREAFLKALLPWPSFLTLEFRITSLPNIACKTQGIFWITLVIRVLTDSAEMARKEAVQAYLALQPLLSSHFIEANFTPITEVDDLEERLAPFVPKHALSVTRRRELLALAEPMRRISVGFAATPPSKTPAEKDRVVHTCPWIPPQDDWSRLLDVLVSLMDPVTIIIRLQPDSDEDSASEVGRVMQIVETCETYLAAKHGRTAPENQVKTIRDVALTRAIGLRSGAFRLGVFIVTPNPINASIGYVVGCSIAEGPDLKNPFYGGFTTGETDLEDALRGDYFAEQELFDASEASCAFRLPSPPYRPIPGLSVRYSRTMMAMMPHRDPSEEGTIKLFVNEHQSVRYPIRMNVEDRMRHLFILGQTGTGKSTLMENMILQDIHAGRGVAVIDPHGDMVENVLASIPRERAEDVIYFDFLDKERPIGFNPIAWSTVNERDLLIDEFYQTLDRIYDMKLTGGPIFEMHFRGMLKLLMGDGSSKRRGFIGTLLDFTPCYTDRKFRNWLANTIDDDQLKDFLTEATSAGGEATLANVSPYVTSKFNRFVNDTMLRNIIGQTKNSFDIDEIVNGGKVFLVRLGKGRFGSNVSALLVNSLVSRFKLAIMKRGMMPPAERKDFFLYVDEAHNLPGENFSELLSEARKYRMSLVLATQYCAQLGGRPSVQGSPGGDLLSAVFGNVGTTVVYRLGPDDARVMSPQFYPYFSPLDIVGLPNFNGYARVLLDAETRPPFSFRADRNRFPRDDEHAARLRSHSRVKYGSPADLVEADIADRRKRFMIDDDE